MEIPEAGYPGLRYVLLHSFAHALMRQFTLECGYTAASIRKRIYSLPPEHEHGPMAGILFYTSAPDSEGTLGGLVGLGIPNQLGDIWMSVEQMRSCTSDPLCADAPARRSILCTKQPVMPVSFFRKRPANAGTSIWTDRCSCQQ